MKKTIFLLIMVLVFCAACTNEKDSITNYDDIEMTTTSMYLDLNYGYPPVDVTVSKELAITMGDMILNERYGAEDMAKYDLDITYFEEKEVYLIQRHHRGYDGGGYEVAINKNSGEIIKVWRSF